MRQIDDLAGVLAKVFFAKDSSKYEIIDEQGNFSTGNFFHYQLMKLLNVGEINKAENLLFEQIAENPNEKNFQIALDFYRELEKLSDEYLDNHEFARTEILEGLISLKQIYNIA